MKRKYLLEPMGSQSDNNQTVKSAGKRGRQNAGDQVVYGFSFAFDWLGGGGVRNSLVISQCEVMQNQCNYGIFSTLK